MYTQWEIADLKGQIMTKMLNGSLDWNEGCWLRNQIDSFTEIKREDKEQIQE